MTRTAPSAGRAACEQLVNAHLAALYARHGLPTPEVREIAPDAPEWRDAASCFANLLDTAAPAPTPLIDFDQLQRQPQLALAVRGI